MKTCPECGKSVVMTYKRGVRCSCGATIHPSGMRAIKMKKSRDSFVCGNCGALVLANATACPTLWCSIRGLNY